MTQALDIAIDLLNSGRGDLAEREVRRLLALEPGNGALHAILAMAIAQQHRYREALPVAREAVRLAPDEKWVLQALAEVLVRVGDGRRGEAAARAAIAADPGEPRFHGLLAAALLERSWRPVPRRRLAEDALRAADAGLAIDPGNHWCMLQRAQALVRLDRVAEARTAAEAALRLEPERPASHTVSGIVETALGRAELGRARLLEALRMDPNHPAARHHLGIGNQHLRDTAAVLIQAREWKVAVRALLAVLCAAVGVGVFRLGATGEWWPALFPAAYLLLPRLFVWQVRRAGPDLLDDLSVPGALLPKERFWARVSIVLWAVFGLGAAAVGIFSL